MGPKPTSPMTTSPSGNAIPPPPRGGFTLIELLVVVAIMGLMAGAAAVSLRSLRSPALNNAAAEVASAMKATRQIAISSGSRAYLCFPIQSNSLVDKPFQSYAIFQELRTGQSYQSFTNTKANPVFIPRTDWRFLPEGVVFCNLSAGGYESITLQKFQGMQLGQALGRQMSGTSVDDQEWRIFESFTNLTVLINSNETNLGQVPFLAFRADGRGFYNNRGFGQGAGIRLVQGVVQNGLVAVTDTNHFYYVETDPFVGRIRLRAKDSYRQ